jgi:ribose 1,5-bisphosphokinase
MSTTGRLVYVVGPSGAGKDSVLQALRQQWPMSIAAHWARRTITRALVANGEAHEAVERGLFEQLLTQNAFAMHWSANGHAYGIRHQELQPLTAGAWVFVNGSRSHLPQMLYGWPDAVLVHISAPQELIAARLRSRQRDAEEEIAARLQRHAEYTPPAAAVCVVNSGDLQDAANLLQMQLLLNPSPRGR